MLSASVSEISLCLVLCLLGSLFMSLFVWVSKVVSEPGICLSFRTSFLLQPQNSAWNKSLRKDLGGRGVCLRLGVLTLRGVFWGASVCV